MFSPQSRFKSRTGSINRHARKLTRARFNLETLEERRVPTAIVPVGAASTGAAIAETMSVPTYLPGLRPATPVIATIMARSASEIDLTWSASTGATGYQVEDSSNGGSTWAVIGSTTAPSDAVTNLNPATTYSFAVEATGPSGNSNVSQAASALTYPAAPTVKVTYEGLSDIEISWNPVPGANDYGIQVGSASPVMVPATETSYWAVGLASGTPYSFTVTAYDLAGGTPSTSVIGTTYAQAPSPTVTAASSSELDLQWKPVSGYAISYQVSIATYSNGNLLSQQTESVPYNPFLTNDTDKLTNLSASDYYIITVGSHDAAGTSWASPMTASTSMSNPAGLSATPESPYDIYLNWQSVPDATGYAVYYSSNGGATWTASASVSAPATGDSVTTLNAATTYTFEVQAFNSAIASSGVYQSAMTLPGATTVKATAVSASEIDLTWNAIPGATSYTVEQGTTKIATLTGNSSTSYKDTGLAAGTTYSFTVIASDASGGTLSAPVSTITYPALPTVNITGDYSTEIDLDWNAVQGATGYTIYEMLSFSSYKVFTQTGNSNTTFKATGLTPDTTYYFMVGATDASGTNLSLNNVVQATTLSGPPARLGVFAWQLSVTAGQSMAVTVTAVDQYGSYCDSNINVELTASTGQSWTVPVDDGSGEVYVNFAHAGTVSLQATYASITSPSATVTVDAPTASLNSIWTGYGATPRLRCDGGGRLLDSTVGLWSERFGKLDLGWYRRLWRQHGRAMRRRDNDG